MITFAEFGRKKGIRTILSDFLRVSLGETSMVMENVFEVNIGFQQASMTTIGRIVNFAAGNC